MVDSQYCSLSVFLCSVRKLAVGSMRGTMLDPLERIIQHSDNGVHNYLTGRGWEASLVYLLAQVIMVGRISCVRAPRNQRPPWLELPSDEGPCGVRFVPSYSFLGQQFALTLYSLEC